MKKRMLVKRKSRLDSTKVYWFLECDAVESSTKLQIPRKNLMPPTSRQKKPVTALHITFIRLVLHKHYGGFLFTV